MSCTARIQRHRRLTTSRSTARVINSNINSFIGYVGKPRTEHEYHIFAHSSHRREIDSISDFQISIADAPVIPLNSILTYQLVAATIPNTFRYWHNVSFTLSAVVNSVSTGSIPTITPVTKIFDGVYDYSNAADFALLCKWSINGTERELFSYDVHTTRLTPKLSLLNTGLLSNVTKVTFTLTGISDNPNVGFPYGFTSSSYTWTETYSTNPATIQTTEELNPVQMIPLFVYMRIEDILHNSIETESENISPQDNTTHSNILTMIPITAGFGDLIIVQPSLDVLHETQNRRDLKTIRVSITDENGHILPMELDWGLELHVKWTQVDALAR